MTRVADAAGLLVDQQDVTPMALAYQAIEAAQLPQPLDAALRRRAPTRAPGMQALALTVRDRSSSPTMSTPRRRYGCHAALLAKCVARYSAFIAGTPRSR